MTSTTRSSEVERGAVRVQGRQRHQPREDDADGGGRGCEHGQVERLRLQRRQPPRHGGEGRADHAGRVLTRHDEHAEDCDHELGEVGARDDDRGVVEERDEDRRGLRFGGRVIGLAL
jgi:hypothetical protein